MEDRPTAKNTPDSVISCWFQHDLCQSGRDKELQPVAAPPGCVKDDTISGSYQADGEITPAEPEIEGAVVLPGQDEKPSTWNMVLSKYHCEAHSNPRRTDSR